MNQEEEKNLSEEEKGEEEAKESEAKSGTQENPLAPESQSGDEGKKTEAEAKPEMSKEERSHQAEMRRLREELEAAKRQLNSYREEKQGSITDKALNDLGITREDLNDPDSMKLAENYMKGLANGEKDPAAYAHRQFFIDSRTARIEAKRATEEQAAKQLQLNQSIEADKANFAREFPGESIAAVMQEGSEFRKAFAGIDLNGNVTAYYRAYKAIKGNGAPSQEAKGMGVPQTGGASTKATQGKSLDDMTDEEFQAWEREHGFAVR